MGDLLCSLLPAGCCLLLRLAASLVARLRLTRLVCTTQLEDDV